MKTLHLSIIVVLLIVVITGSQTTFAQTPNCRIDICTSHDQWLSYLLSSYPDDAPVPVTVLFKNQLTPEEIKAGMTINSTGRFDIEGEVKLIESYGGKIDPTNRIYITNLLAANVAKDKIFALENDPRVWSVDVNSPTQAAVMPLPNGLDVHYPNGTVIHVPNPYANSTKSVLAQTPDCHIENCTHNQMLSKWVSSLPNGSIVPVVILFHGQPSIDDIKSHKKMDYTGDIELIKSYGGNVTNTYDIIHAAAANIPKNKVLALANDPRIESVDLDYPSCVIPEGCPSNNSTHPSQYVSNSTSGLTNPATNNSTPNSVTSNNTDNNPSTNTSEDKIKNSSPLKQLESGIAILDVKCNGSFILVVKESNKHPACVKPSTATKLLAHGWITTTKFQSMNLYPLTKVRNGTINPVGTVIVKDLPPPGKYVPPQKESATPLPPIPVTPIISVSTPNIIKIVSVGMSPYPLKVGDIPHFTVTYQNISDKPIYGIGGCGSDLNYNISPSTNVENGFRYLPTCAEYSALIKPNQTITDETFPPYNYKIIQQGQLQVTMTLLLGNEPFTRNINATLQFFVNATNADSTDNSYKTDKDGVITVTNKSICVPTQIATNGAMDKTSFDVVSIGFPSTGSVSLVGVTTLSSSNKVATIPFPSGTLNGHYNLATNSTIINCGIAYCKGENCNPNKELRTTNESVFINDTKGYCTSPMGACRGPFSSTDTSISAPSPSMEQGIPYTYKFYLVDSLGKYEEWFFGLEYKPQT